MLQGERYQDRPIYFSDVIVRRDSTVRSFADLRGRSWSFNDCGSHSGYNLTRYRLAVLGETGDYFGRVVRAGSHLHSIDFVRAGEVAASAIDCQVLGIALRERAGAADELRVIDSLGPSSIQPVVAAARLPVGLKAEMTAALLCMADDGPSKEALAYGLVRRFAPVTDSTYDDIRAMLATAEERLSGPSWGCAE